MAMRSFTAFIILLYLSLVYPTAVIYAYSINDQMFVTSADKYLFNLSNMAPGDQVNNILTIQNKGEGNITYSIEAKFINGSKELYSEFLIKVWDMKGLVYDGKLLEFKGLSPRYLNSKHQEDLKFEVTFPYELGNEFQGIGFEFELMFIAEETDPNSYPNPDQDQTPDPDQNPIPSPDSSTDPTPEPNQEDIPEEPLNPIGRIPVEELKLPPGKRGILPSTATNMYNNLLIGIILIITGAILFLLQKKRGRN